MLFDILYFFFARVNKYNKAYLSVVLLNRIFFSQKQKYDAILLYRTFKGPAIVSCQGFSFVPSPRQYRYSLYTPIPSGVYKFGIHLDVNWKYIFNTRVNVLLSKGSMK